MPEPTDFQKATIDHVLARFADPAGSGRFLVADEVGLGKTIVAAGVIQRMAAEQRLAGRKYLTVLYMCSNQELAEQNRTRLLDGVEVAPYVGPGNDKELPKRLTMVAPAAAHIAKAREQGGVQLFSFTPGTSLEVKSGTGAVTERQLLYAAVRDLWAHRIGQNESAWLHYFEAGATKSWEWLAKDDRLDALAKDLGDSRMLGKIRAKLDSGGSPVGAGTLLDGFERGIATSSRKGTLIGALRLAVAKAALDFLEPDLVILDEFQRFQQILDMKDGGDLPRQLFEGAHRAKVLILSATPYKLLSRPGEGENHYDGLFQTLGFLAGSPADSEILALRKDFQEYHQGFADRAPMADLLPAKQRIETRMRRWLSRTERLWYMTDVRNDIQTDLSADRALGVDELADYIGLHKLVRDPDRKDPLPSACVLDFWKSAPAPLAFLDAGYALHKQLKASRCRIDTRLVPPQKEHKHLAARNHRMSQLCDRIWRHIESPEHGWRHLWVKPTYTYHQDKHFQDDNPAKFLIFSHWRFVPKAVSYVVSGAFEKGLRKRSRSGRAARGVLFNLEALRVCFPFVWLAEVADPFVLAVRHAAADGSPPPMSNVRTSVRTALVRHMESHGIKVGKRGHRTVWSTLLALEAERTGEDCIGRLQRGLPKNMDGTNKLLRLVQKQVDAGRPRTLVKQAIEDLVDMALGSPAVCIARTLLRRHAGLKVAPGSLVPLDQLGLQELRAWANKEYVQAIVAKGQRGKRQPTRWLVDYCRDAHFQAVVDEYLHPLLDSGIRKACAELGRVLDLGAGSPRANQLDRRGKLTDKSKPQQASFALAFGDGPATEAQQRADGRPVLSPAARRTAMREAFNSPFWPFVLATTSVGQEGLDFHRYCQDIVHWNIPGSPVDLEQREGRLNRYDALFIRRNIAMDHPLSLLQHHFPKRAVRRPVPFRSPWDLVFSAVGKDGLTRHLQHRHGLYPHWAYEPHKTGGRSAPGEAAKLRRHLLFFSGSRDERDYSRLEDMLWRYRLALGHPRQHTLLNEPRHGTDGLSDPRSCIVNLSPVPAVAGRRRAEALADRLVDDPGDVRQLVLEARAMLTKHVDELHCVRARVERMCGIVEASAGAECGKARPVVRACLVALAYLVDPYDARFDALPHQGFLDDIDEIEAVSLGEV